MSDPRKYVFLLFSEMLWGELKFAETLNNSVVLLVWMTPPVCVVAEETRGSQ